MSRPPCRVVGILVDPGRLPRVLGCWHTNHFRPLLPEYPMANNVRPLPLPLDHINNELTVLRFSTTCPILLQPSQAQPYACDGKPLADTRAAHYSNRAPALIQPWLCVAAPPTRLSEACSRSTPRHLRVLRARLLCVSTPRVPPKDVQAGETRTQLPTRRDEAILGSKEKAENHALHQSRQGSGVPAPFCTPS